jgi:hypothetical protein
MPKVEKDSAENLGELGFAALVRSALKETLRRSAKSVEEITSAISKRLGTRITVGMIHDFTAESHPHRFPLEYAAAWIAETGDFSILYVLSDALGLPRQSQQDADLLAYGKLSLQKDLTVDEAQVLKARILKGGVRG